MKLFKKVMAIALASVLALSVLTGCGGKDGLGFNSSSLANALTDVATMQGDEITFTADTAMDAQAQKLAKFAEEQTKDMTLTPSEIGRMLDNTQVIAAINQELNIKSVSETAPLYYLAMAEVSDKITANDTKNVYYADSLLDNIIPINNSAKEWKLKNGKVAIAMGMATAKIAGRDYIVMLMKTSDVAKRPNK